MKSEKISRYLKSRIEARDFPSAVYLAAERGEIVFQDAMGASVVEPEEIEAKIDTIYDLASLTKPLVTGLLFAKLIETGKVNLKDRIAKYFGEFDTIEKHGVRLENLLAHTSGFLSWEPLYLTYNRETTILELIASRGVKTKPNREVEYSDLNFLTLGYLLELIYETTLDKIAESEIFSPLELQNTLFNPPKGLKEKIAASEFGNEYEKQTCINLGYDVSGFDWREYQIWGEVHDGNCWFLNCVSGHAGLFSTAEETFKIARQFLADETVLLKPETCRLFRTNFTPGLNEARSLAFQLAETRDSTAGAALSKDSFGHLGFTGTSLWIEPETERIFILLTNRTHARELPFANINSVRRRFHELAGEELNRR
jgi:CubicO group peptidase (beta-lactamase class C family)